MTAEPRKVQDQAFRVLKKKLVQKSNLYELNRLTIVWGTILGPAVVFSILSALLGSDQIFIPRAGLFYLVVSPFLLKLFLLPDRVVLWLRPFATTDAAQFNLAWPLHTSVVPFARVVALAHVDDRGGESCALIDTKSGAMATAERLIYRIHKKSSTIRTGSLVKCPDAEWQSVISYWLRIADFVILDVSHIGQGLAWEIDQVCQKFGPDSVVFCVPEAADASADLPLGALTRALGDWYPGRRRIVRFPLQSSSEADRCEITGRLITHITDCLALEQLNSAGTKRRLKLT